MARACSPVARSETLESSGYASKKGALLYASIQYDTLTSPIYHIPKVRHGKYHMRAAECRDKAREVVDVSFDHRDPLRAQGFGGSAAG